MSARAPAFLTRLVGELPGRPTGVSHVAAVWAGPGGEYATLRVGEGAPRSEDDAVLLSGARARADAIVTTGRILRDEPGLVHASIAPREQTEALVRWRRALGLEAAPWIAVLTGSGDIPLGHPALAAARSILFTGASGAARLRAAKAMPAHAEVVECDAPSAARLVSHLRDARGAHSILVEAGASTAGALYEAPGLIDELWLNVCLAPELSSEHIVGPFVERAAIEATLGPPVHERRCLDAGVEWATLVHRRAARPNA